MVVNVQFTVTTPWGTRTVVMMLEEKFVPRIGTVNTATNFVMKLQSTKDVMKTEN